MADGRPAAPPESPPGDAFRPEDVDEDRLSEAMAALLGGGWPDAGDDSLGFTLPPPRRFDDEPIVGQPATAASIAEPGIGDEPVPGEQFWAPPEPPPSEPAAEASATEASPIDGSTADAPAGLRGPNAVAGVWRAGDDPTQAHVWGPADEMAADEDLPAAADIESAEPAGSAKPAPPDLWTADPAGRASAAADADPDDDAEDRAALVEAGLAGPMNVALSDLRRLGGTDADATEWVAPATAAGYGGPGRLSELQGWWSERGRELLPSLAVAAVVVLAFAVVLLGRGGDSEDSKVDTVVSVTTAVPTTVPADLFAPLDPPLDDPFGAPEFGEPGDPAAATAGTGSGAPTVGKPAPATRRPSSGASGPGPASPAPGGAPKPGGGTATTAPPATTGTTSPPDTTPPPTVPTTTTPPDDTPSQRCDFLPELCSEGSG